MIDYKKIADLLFPNITKTVKDYLDMYPARNLPKGAQVTRLAPSPTGYMHIGSIYQALIDSCIAKQTGGVFYLRNEDTDSKREVQGAADIFTPILNGFGIYPNEGFVKTGVQVGDYGPYVQSQRKEIYQTFAKHLVSQGLAYPCFCDGEDEQAKKEQLEQGLQLGYYGKWAKCRNLTAEQVEENLKAGKSFTIRIKSNGDGVKRFKFKDLRIGECELPVNSNDYVILKSDGQTLYHLAHLVDDTLMHTTTVVRDETWFSSVPLHVQLFEYFNLPRPNYLHTPTVNTIDKQTGNARKVSKRKDDWADSRWFFKQGFPPQAVTDYLMNLLNSNYESWREQNPNASLYDFNFNINGFSKSGALFDIVKIENISKNILGRTTANDLLNQAIEWAKEYDQQTYNLLSADKAHSLAVLSIDRNIDRPRKDLATYADIKSVFSYCFNGLYTNDFLFDYEKFRKDTILNVLINYKNAFNFNTTKEEWFNDMKVVAQKCGFATDNKLYKSNPEMFIGNMADFSCIVRVAITGRTQSPDLYSIIKVIGSAETINRLNQAINYLSK